MIRLAHKISKYQQPHPVDEQQHTSAFEAVSIDGSDGELPSPQSTSATRSAVTVCSPGSGALLCVASGVACTSAGSEVGTASGGVVVVIVEI